VKGNIKVDRCIECGIERVRYGGGEYKEEEGRCEEIILRGILG
jgi:hypothetical protein